MFHPGENTEVYYRKPGVWDDVEPMFEARLREFPRDNCSRSEYACAAVYAGKWRLAKKLFAEIGMWPDYTVFGNEEFFNHMRRLVEEEYAKIKKD